MQLNKYNIQLKYIYIYILIFQITKRTLKMIVLVIRITHVIEIEKEREIIHLSPVQSVEETRKNRL